MLRKLILWLVDRFDISLIDETRIPNGMEVKARAERWKAFALEQGGLFDMIEAQRRAEFEAFADLRPNQLNEKAYLAQQDRCWRQVRARVESIIMTGKVAADKEAQEASVIQLRKSV